MQPSSDAYSAEVVLGDGRRVALHYRYGKGLFEQRYNPQAGAWTRPRALYRTKTDPCQGIKLQARGGTVVAMADFGIYCYDGEPPAESIASVATGSLQEWDVHRTRDIDGWEKATISADGTRVAFATMNAGSLRWTRSGGFSEPVLP